MESLADIARRHDETVRAARDELVQAVRTAAARGMTQSEIAREIGRSQPEVSRLLHFHGSTPLARRLRAARRQIRDEIGRLGGKNVRVFGSVATGTEQPDSDVDLLFTMGEPLSLMELSALEAKLAEQLGADVDLLPDTALRDDVRQRILDEAVPL